VHNTPNADLSNDKITKSFRNFLDVYRDNCGWKPNKVGSVDTISSTADPSLISTAESPLISSVEDDELENGDLIADDIVAFYEEKLERVKQQYSEENASLKAKVLSLNAIVQGLQQSTVKGKRLMDGITSSGRILSLLAVKPIAQKYYDEHNVGGILPPEHQKELRQLIKDQHAELNPNHYYAKELMNDQQLKGYIYRLTDAGKEVVKRVAMDKLAKKKAILDDILSKLPKNEPLIEPGSREAAYIIQCIFVSGSFRSCMLFTFDIVLHVSHYIHPCVIRIMHVYTTIQRLQLLRCSLQSSCKSNSLGRRVKNSSRAGE